jgi:uncharacterized membrane protein YgcG
VSDRTIRITTESGELVMKQALTDGLSTFAEFVPKLIGFLLILIIGLFVAKMIAKAVGKILERVGFDKAVERGGVKRALEQSKFDASDIVGKLAYYALALFVLQMAFGVFGPNPVSDLLTQVISFLPSLVVAIIIVVIASAVAAAVKTLIDGTLGGLSYGKVLSGLASGFILFLGVIAALNQVGVATTVTTPILVAILATLSGVIIVGAGGGLIKPMQHRWENYLSKAEDEAPRIRQHAASAPGVKEQAQQKKDQAQQAYAQADGHEEVGSYGGRTYGGSSYGGSSYGGSSYGGSSYEGGTGTGR